MNILVTGGAGFIGSNFLNLFVKAYSQHYFINIDKLTYAANLMNLESISDCSNYHFIKGDLAEYINIERVFDQYKPDLVVNLAAESHVDRSICGPTAFIKTNIIGTFNLLEVCRKYWFNGNSPVSKLFLHVSTDEVYGSLGLEGFFTESSAYNPSSPYSASKASSDHLVRAYYRTYGLPAIITNCSNNYGPFQFPEKLIPLVILNAMEGKELPVYGRGENIRDWLYVVDHCRALWEIIENGVPGETYNIGGGNEWKNLDLIKKICYFLAEETGKLPEQYLKLISFVSDRPGHDLRYAIDCSKIRNNLQWKPQEDFVSGLRKTIRWYLSNQQWISAVKTGAYCAWLKDNYSNR